MRNYFGSLLLASGLFQGAALASPQCKQDKCFLAAQSNYNAVGAKKSPGCHAYLDRVNTPAVVTVTRPAKTVTTTTTMTVPATSTAVSLTTSYLTIGQGTTVTAPPATTTIVVKRAPNTSTCPAPKNTTPALPALATTACKGVASAFVSACSCIGIRSNTKTLQPCTTTVTGSVSTSTVTVTFATAAPTTSTVVVPTTIFTSTSTVVPQSAATTFSVPSVAGCQYAHNYFYSLYYSGAGYSETANNPGNNIVGADPISTTFSGGLVPCDAIAACSNFAFPQYYDSFDVHYLASTQNWNCVAYYNDNDDPSYFNQANSDIIAGYGFTTAS